MKSYKCTISIVFFLVAALTAPLASFGITYESYQQNLPSRIDAGISKINALKTQIQTNPDISADTKQQTVAALDAVEATLIAYQADITEATTLKEIQALNQEILAYFIQNKDVLIEQIKIVVADLGAQLAAETQELIQEIEQLLVILKKTCPKQAATITEIETQLAQLESLGAQLSAAVKAKSTAQIKSLMNAITALSEDLVKNIELIEAECVVKLP